MRISKELGLDERGEILLRREGRRLEAVREQADRFRRPTVVALEWTDPIFAMGKQLRDADPEYLIVAPCGFNLERTLREQVVLERYPWWGELQAVRKGNVAFADGNLFFNRSGMMVSQSAEIIAEILHGIQFGVATEGVHWRWQARRVTSAARA